ncbi:outer membrane protein [Roseovarius sp. M141]|uniref:outer membrane protein n=1 Tax=Roseovarius sp. M141 TaxID=2583806 RepID=UPI0020CEF861|nr:outer membrane beta-barrel protein [Roseovarius sp. M141]MCQ0092243.1 hypothetical protein [Roseovarius sp. M141]
MGIRIAALACLAFCPALAAAEDTEYSATLYGWLPGISGTLETSFGDADLGQSTGDVLSNLDMAFMGTFEARSGPWGVIADLLYTELSDTESTPFGAAFNSLEMDIKVAALSGYLAYRVTETPTVAVDIAGGFRAFDIDLSHTLTAGALPARSSSASESWLVPVVGVRGNWRMSQKWSATGFVDFGASGSDKTWQVLGTLNYAFNENWSGRFGYRYMEIDKSILGSDVDLGLSGPVVGVSYRF